MRAPMAFTHVPTSIINDEISVSLLTQTKWHVIAPAFVCLTGYGSRSLHSVIFITAVSYFPFIVKSSVNKLPSAVSWNSWISTIDH